MPVGPKVPTINVLYKKNSKKKYPITIPVSRPCVELDLFISGLLYYLQSSVTYTMQCFFVVHMDRPTVYNTAKKREVGRGILEFLTDVSDWSCHLKTWSESAG